jgi:hypothetical protein
MMSVLSYYRIVWRFGNIVPRPRTDQTAMQIIGKYGAREQTQERCTEVTLKHNHEMEDMSAIAVGRGSRACRHA